MEQIHARAFERNRLSRHSNPPPQRTGLTRPASSTGTTPCLRAGPNTDWPAVIDGCRDLLVVAFGVNAASEAALFERACCEADRKSAARQHLERLRRLVAEDVSLDRAWHELRPKGAAASIVEALIFALRRGIDELTKADSLRRLSALDEGQLKAVCRRVQNFNPEIATSWSSDEVSALIAKWKELHERR